MSAAEVFMGAAEMDRRAFIGHAIAEPAIAGVQADLVLPRSEWQHPATAAVVAEAVTGMGSALRGDVAYQPLRPKTQAA